MALSSVPECEVELPILLFGSTNSAISSDSARKRSVECPRTKTVENQVSRTRIPQHRSKPRSAAPHEVHELIKLDGTCVGGSAAEEAIPKNTNFLSDIEQIDPVKQGTFSPELKQRVEKWNESSYVPQVDQ
jgi:hypothetical protein